MNFQLNMGLFFRILVTIFILATIGNCTERDKDLLLSSNDKESIIVSSISSLNKMEAGQRDDSNSYSNVNGIEGRSKNVDSSVNEKSDKEPIILGTSKVAIVYSEGKSSFSSSDKDKNGASKQQGMAPRVVYPSHKESLVPVMANDRNWRDVRVSSVRDSYLEALEHSKTSKDPHEGIIRTEPKKFYSKLTRRENSEGPVYRHPSHEDNKYESGIKEPGSGISSSYSLLGSSLHEDINNRPMRKNIGRISYGGPTPEPDFLPTPSHSYSLPAIQTFPNYQNNDFYASPQISYPPPAALPQTHIYGPPFNNNNNNNDNNNYNSRPQSHADGVSQTSYGLPTNNRYPGGTPQQAYGVPSSSSSSSSSSVYGAPYATQDYSQNLLPSLPSMDLIWPFALKLNAFTLAKILLKLVIFKMIVKFIGVICLLLFIPKLEIIKKVGNNDDDSDDSRELDKPWNSSLEPLNILTAFVTNSIQKYEKKNVNFSQTPKDCTNIDCRMRKMNIDEESWNDWARLFDNYVAEESNDVVVDENR